MKLRSALNKSYRCRLNEAALLSGSFEWKGESQSTRSTPCHWPTLMWLSQIVPIWPVKTDILTIFICSPAAPLLISWVPWQFPQAVRVSVCRRGCSQFSLRFHKTIRRQTAHREGEISPSRYWQTSGWASHDFFGQLSIK